MSRISLSEESVPKRKAIIPIGPSIAYIPLTKGQYALVEVEDVAELAPWNWSATWIANKRCFGARRFQNGIGIAMHQQLCPVDAGMVPDHRNGNSLDNRRCGNLRPATNRQNLYNSRRRQDNTSGFKGVSFRKRIGMYSAEIKIDGKTKHLLSTPDLELAAAAYREAAVKAAGEFARFE